MLRRRLPFSLLRTQRRFLSYTPRTREWEFLLNEVFNMPEHYAKMGHGEMATPDTISTILEESAKLCTNTLFPLYESGDVGCILENGQVKTPKGFKEAWKLFVDGGWSGLAMPEAYGGQGMPRSLGMIQKEMLATANWAWFMYHGLSSGAAETLLAHGSDEQKDLYLRKLVDGTWSGTMCLTEPHCGTDLGQIKTRAKPSSDGSYRITGTKIFISAGDHDFTPNIVHIVLAKLPDAPKGTKGISLFLVPRHVVKSDGSLVPERNVKSVGLEKKMGIAGNSTMTLSFEGSLGYLIGKPHDGMRQMFTFMNLARLGSAIQGVIHAELAFQNALIQSQERLAMRALSGAKEPELPADPIHVHGAVRQNVLFAKAIAEGGRAFMFDLGRIADKLDNAKTPEERKAVDAELGLLTPIAKGFLTEMGCEAASQSMQVFGGSGYIKATGMEQICRDARISTLYEGTTGIQALDFLGRKILMNKGRNLGKFHARVSAEAWKHITERGILGRHSRSLFVSVQGARAAQLALYRKAMSDYDFVGTASVDMLMYYGYFTLAYYWLRMGAVAQAKVDATEDPTGFYQAKLDTCNFYFQRIFPRSVSHSQMMLVDPGVLLKPNIRHLG